MIHLGMTMAEYLALKAVNAGVVQAMIDECPQSAWYSSAWNPKRPTEDEGTDEAAKKRRRRGTVAHSILLEGSQECVAVIDPEDHPAEKTGNIPDGWTNKSIRGARDMARQCGLIPILKSDMAEISAMVEAAHVFIDSLKESEPAVWSAFQPDGGRSEVTLTWMDGQTLCKMRPDKIANDNRLIVNYKTTQTSVEPDRWGRTQMIGAGHYIGAAWYRRGIKALFGVRCDYVFLVQSTEAPYLCSLVGMDPAAFELGAAKCASGLRDWQRCEELGRWPGYPPRVCYPEVPIYETARWQEKEAVNYGSQA